MLSHKFFATHLVVVVKSEKVSERRVPYFSLNINDQSTAKRIHYIPIFVFYRAGPYLIQQTYYSFLQYTFVNVGGTNNTNFVL